MSDTSQLGFHNLPFLAHRKSVKRGFEFTLMVVGELLLWLGCVEPCNSVGLKFWVESPGATLYIAASFLTHLQSVGVFYACNVVVLS